jgi:hypothetical protein
MTIKQQGGIFGRNPTFNNVEVDGTLTLEGGLLTNSAITVNALSSTIESTSGAELFLSRDDTAVANNNLIGGLAFKANDSTASPDPQYCGMKAYAAGSGNNPVLELYAGNGNYEARTPQLSINYLGDVTVETGNLIIGTSGKGIDFSATAGTGTSELFDDYEEGTWTPTLLGSSSNPTVTYGLQRGLYTKVGRLVTITCNLGWSAYSGGSGNAYVGNFPFSIEGATGAYGGAAISAADNITYVASRDNLGLFLLSGTTSARLQCFGSGATTQTIVTSSVGSTGQLVFSASYQI